MPIHHRLLVPLCLVWSTSAVAQTDGPACATVNADELLRNSGASKDAQQRLAAEFQPKFDAIEPLVLARSQAESHWLEAKRTGRPAAETDSLKERFDQALAAERSASAPLRQALDRRKREELNALVARMNDVYKRLGAEQGFKLLLQHGAQEPIFVLERGIVRAQCTREVDVTPEIIQRLDREDRASP